MADDCISVEGARMHNLKGVTVRIPHRALTIAEVNELPIDEAVRYFERLPLAEGDEASQRIVDEVLTRLRYLSRIGLGYLHLNRASRTLSGGEIQRVNLTACLGNSLVNTLFVLYEPTQWLLEKARKLGGETIAALVADGVAGEVRILRNSRCAFFLLN
jgi:excinuclease ABC subunit A